MRGAALSRTRPQERLGGHGAQGFNLASDGAVAGPGSVANGPSAGSVNHGGGAIVRVDNRPMDTSPESVQDS